MRLRYSCLLEVPQARMFFESDAPQLTRMDFCRADLVELVGPCIADKNGYFVIRRLSPFRLHKLSDSLITFFAPLREALLQLTRHTLDLKAVVDALGVTLALNL